MSHKLVSALLLSAVALAAPASDAHARNDSRAVSPQAPALAAPDDGGLGSAILSAVVSANGTLARGSGVSKVVKADLGGYRVIFKRSVRPCAYVATIGLPGASGTEENGTIDVVGDNLDVKGVFVNTGDPAGNHADRGFHLIVVCNR